MLKPVMIISTICMANASKSKKPLYQEEITSSGSAPIHNNAPKAVIIVRSMAKTKALGMYFRKRSVNFSPNIFIMETIFEFTT